MNESEIALRAKLEMAKMAFSFIMRCVNEGPLQAKIAEMALERPNNEKE